MISRFKRKSRKSDKEKRRLRGFFASLGKHYSKSTRKPIPRYRIADSSLYDVKKGKAILTEIKPSEYLFLTRADEGLMIWDKADVNSTATLEKKLEEGQPIDVPFLEIDENSGKIIGHDGRHRALASTFEGLKEIPVETVVMKKSGGIYEEVHLKDVPEKDKQIMLHPEKLERQEKWY